MARAGVGPWLHPATVRGQLRLLVGALAAALALALAAAALFVGGLDRVVQARTEVDELRRSEDALDDAFVTQMTAANAYVITGDADELARYRQGLIDATSATASLRRVLAGDPEGVAALDAVIDAQEPWRAALNEQVDRRTGAGEVEQDVAATTQAIAAFDDLQSAMRVLDDEVNAAVEDVRERARADQRTGLWLLSLSLAGVAVVLVLAARSFTRSVTRPLEQLAADATAVAEGDLQHHVRPGGPEEVASVGAAVDAMRVRLLRERSVAARRSLLTGQEDERRRLAMGIHDDSVQAVLAASLRLQRLRRRLRGVDDESVQLVRDVQKDLEEAISRLRRMIFELHPPTLDRDGLEAAMRLYLAETLEPAGVTWKLETAGEEVRQDAVTDALVYRLFREAVLNVLRHADASDVRVTLAGTHGDVQVVIEDDGVGFDPAEHETPVPGHLGLLASRQLCEATGGQWEVVSAPDQGTRVRYRVPGSLS